MRFAWPAVIALALGVGALTLDGGFVYDDGRALLQNPLVAGDLPAAAAFTHDYWGGPIDQPIRSYRPLIPLVWHGLWALAPKSPLPFRLFSCLLHVAATASVFALLLRVLKERAALAGALLFAVHPVHAEAVGAIVGQSDLASAALGCAVLVCGTATLPRAWWSAALLLVACAAKETAVVFGVALLAATWAEQRKGALTRCLPSALVMLVVIGVQLSFERAPGGVMPESLAISLDGFLRVVYGFHIIGHATSLLVMPTGLAPHHGFAAVQPSLESLGPFAVVGALATLCGLLLFVHGVRTRNGVLLGALALWLGPLAIQSGFLVTPVTDIAERLLYTPSVAACGALGLGLTRAIAQERRQSAALALVLLVLAGLTADAQRAWVSDMALWSRGIMVEPRSWQAQKNYAAELSLAGRNAEAAWPFLVSFALVRRYPAPIDWEMIEALEEKPLEERLAEGPFALEPQDGCKFARVYLKNMQKSAPEVVAVLGPVYRARGCSNL
jgi:hypothetical protein